MAMHPSKEELSGFLLGKLPPAATEAVAQHLEVCPPCQETVVGLETNQDTLLRKLQQASPPPPPAKDPSITSAFSPPASGTKPPTAPPPTRDQLIATLGASGLMDEEEWNRLQSVAAIAQAADGATLARALVQHGTLTKFQATVLYQGKAQGLIFGEYVVLDLLGSGGMGQVFKARHRSMDRIVALKVLAKAAVNSPDAVKRFQREVKAAGKLIHPNIVTAFDAGQQDGVHFLVMEYVPGSDLSALVKRDGPLPVDKVVSYMTQAARGLAFAHGEGVVHRDIKPGNLLVDQKGIVRILDMGLARLDGDAASKAAGEALTQTGQVMGTVDYMAPEQAFDTSKADAKADMYSLGCTLYRILTGQNMFTGDTLVQKILAHREQPIPTLAATCPTVLPQLDSIYQRMVAKQPAGRPTMAELVTELELLSKGEPTTSFAPNALAVDITPKVSREAKPSAKKQESGVRSQGSGKKPPRSRKLVAAGATGFLLICLGVWLIVRDKDGNETARVQMPAGGMTTIQDDGASKNLPSPAAAINPVGAGSGETGSAVKDSATNVDVVFLGTDTFAKIKTKSVGNAVWEQMASQWRVESLAYPGRTISRTTSDLRAVYLNGWKPRVFVIHVGDEDKATDQPGQAIESYRNFVQKIIDTYPQAAVILMPTIVDPKAPDDDARFHRELNDAVRALADQRRIFVVDPNEIVFQQDGTLHPGLITTPGITLTALGHERWAEAMLPLLTKLLSPSMSTSVAVPGPQTQTNAPPPAIAPFDAAQARAHQEAWARHLGTTVETTNSIGMTMVIIPAGKFIMGSPKSELGRGPGEVEHEVTLTRPFALAARETTIAQFQRFIAETGYVTVVEQARNVGGTPAIPAGRKKGEKRGVREPAWNNPGYVYDEDYPVSLVDWADTEVFCRWLSQRERKIYRLPTEAEWEFACRAGTQTMYSFDHETQPEDRYAWVGQKMPHRVGRLAPNPFGLYDMHGNVSEFCSDWFSSGYYGSRPDIDPKGPATGEAHVNRGGGWRATGYRSAARQESSEDPHSWVGFRVVSEILASPSQASASTAIEAGPSTTSLSVSAAPPAAPPIAVAPFDAAQARAHQDTWAKHLGVPVEFTNSIGMKFMLIPPGEFLMGSTDEQVEAALKVIEETGIDYGTRRRIEGSERPQHRVTITKPLYFGVTEVTVAHFKKFAAATGYKTEAETATEAKTYLSSDFASNENLPVAAISWGDAVAFCDWLSKQGDRPVDPLPGTPYRLPTEAEWEFACRAGTTTQYSFGDDYRQLDQFGWSKTNSNGNTHSVAAKPSNPFGLFDMHGNVTEWCRDFYDEKAYESTSSKDPAGAAIGSTRVLRGGRWNHHPLHCRSAHRDRLDPTPSTNVNGFRVVREIPLPQSAASTAPSVDLLKVIDTAKGKAGKWAVNDGVLEGTGNVVTSTTLPFDYEAPEEYDLRAVIERMNGDKLIALGLTAGATRFFLDFDSQLEEPIGFGLIDAKRRERIAGARLSPGLRHDVLVQVRRSGVRLAINGRSVFDNSSSLNRLSRDEEKSGTSSWFLRVYNHIRFHKLELTPIVAPTPRSLIQPPLPAVAPFDAAQARAHQEAWANYLGTTVETTNSVGMKMVLIPPGEFMMGSTDEQVEAALKVADETNAASTIPSIIEKAERPQHKVVITKPFLMSATEVTIGHFKKFAAATGYQTEAEQAEIAGKTAPPTPTTPGRPPPKPIQTYINPGYIVSDDLPVAFIARNDAVAYCQWLSTQEKITHRLPTEAEWEYACRAGTTTQYSFGDDVALLDQYGWYNKNADGKSHPVGMLLPNGFGLFDMHGNLYEWCGDWYDEKWYEKSSTNDPIGPAGGSHHVIRGGHWTYYASSCRSAYRGNIMPKFRNAGHHNGFRCVRVLDTAPEKITASVVAPAATAPLPATPLSVTPPVLSTATPRPTPRNSAAPSPFDLLRREDIPPDELREAGLGDPAKAPKELVAVFGASHGKHWGSVQGLAYSPDGKTVASAGGDGTIKLWDAVGGAIKATLLGDRTGIAAVAFSPDGRWLASAGAVVHLWNAADGKLASTLTGHRNGVQCVVFSPDSLTLASSGADAVIELWDVTTAKNKASLTGHHAKVGSVAFSSDGRTLASGSEDGTIKLWNVESGEVQSTLTEDGGVVDMVAFGPDGLTLASLIFSKDKSPASKRIKLWDVSTGKEKASLTGNSYFLGFTPDGESLVAMDHNVGIRRWDASTGQARTKAAIPLFRSGVHGVALNPNGREIALGGFFGTMGVYDLASGRERMSLTGEDNEAMCVALTVR